MADIIQPELTYYQQRMKALGITPELNQIELWRSSTFNSEHKGENYLAPVPIFRESTKGIEILVYDIERNKLKTTKTASRSSVPTKVIDKDYCITRLEFPIKKNNGSEQKYNKPSGEPSYPFYPPKLVSKYTAEKKYIRCTLQRDFLKHLRQICTVLTV